MTAEKKLYIIAGCNDAGKTTASFMILFQKPIFPGKSMGFYLRFSGCRPAHAVRERGRWEKCPTPA